MVHPSTTPSLRLARLAPFVCGSPGQLGQLQGCETVAALFERVRKDCARYATEVPDNPDVLYKRHVLHYLNHRCRGVHLDVGRLVEEGIVRVEGSYPKQTLRLLRPEESCHMLNDGFCEEEAFLLALKRSLPCPLSRLPMREPVRTIHGEVYEREYIERWLERFRTDPLSGERLLTTALFPA